MKLTTVSVLFAGAIVPAAVATSQPSMRTTEPYALALEGAWTASRGKDAARFATYVATGASLRIERAEAPFKVGSLSTYAAKCRFIEKVSFNHPKPGSPHYGKPYTSWAAVRIGCTGMPSAQYALTVWFDSAGKIESGHLMTPVAVPG